MKPNTTTALTLDEPTPLIDGRPVPSTSRNPRPHGWERDFSRGRREATSTRELERDLLRISEREHRRIGHDLHDGICQELAAVHFAIEASKKLAGDDHPLAERLGRISLGIHRAIQHTRLISRGLAPYELEDGDLCGSLHELVETTSTLHQVTCRTRICSSIGSFDSETATQLFRIAQEAIQNAIRHGDATEIEVALGMSGRKVVLSVTDDGNGLPDSIAPASSHGMGWKIMRYRASRLGGTIDVTSAPTGRGVCVRCSFCAPSLLDQ